MRELGRLGGLSLYMDDATRIPRADFPQLQAHLATLAERVAAFARSRG